MVQLAIDSRVDAELQQGRCHESSNTWPRNPLSPQENRQLEKQGLLHFHIIRKEYQRHGLRLSPSHVSVQATDTILSMISQVVRVVATHTSTP